MFIVFFIKLFDSIGIFKMMMNLQKHQPIDENIGNDVYIDINIGRELYCWSYSVFDLKNFKYISIKISPFEPKMYIQG